jgi:hypothetical protein
MRFSAFAQTSSTYPEKVEAMPRDLARNKITYSIMEVLLRWNVKVHHDTAVFTHKMIVLIHCCIVAMKPFSKIEFLNFTLSCEDVEVSIDGAK